MLQAKISALIRGYSYDSSKINSIVLIGSRLLRYVL